jgi:hypothetical protein
VLRQWLVLIVLIAAAQVAPAQDRSSAPTPAAAQSQSGKDTSSAQTASQQDSTNGIFVGEPKVYDDRSLQLLLNNLRTRLGQISGLDQASLISKIGALQGASATTLGFSMQANGTPSPGIVTTGTQATPTTTQTTGGTTTTTPSSMGTTTTVTAPTGTTTTTTTTSSTTATTTASNQSVVSAPGSTLSTQTTSPSVTPTPPAIANVPSFSLPSTFSPSALDVLGEQMQLSSELINLQLLLDGSLNDQYVRGTHLIKPHTTLGFPISITAPSGDEYRNAVAEVEVTVCDPPVVKAMSEAPSLMTILPREKTYNVASITNKSVSLGASGIIAGVISVGANFLWGHQTYYVVEDQDTVAIQRDPRGGVCKQFQKYAPDGKTLVDAGESKPVTFAWQFRPVLGQKVVRQGLRQTFAQISFPPYPETLCTGTVKVRTRWLEYDAKHGLVGDEIGGSVSERDSEIPYFFPDSYIGGITTVDNLDGTTTVKVLGAYLSGTKVRVGLSFLDESMPGFQNSVGNYIRFVAPNQALALNGASLVTRDGVETEIFADSGISESLPACGPAKPPQPDPQAVAGTGAHTSQRDAAESTPAGRVAQESASTDELGSESNPTSDSKVTLNQFSDSLVEVTVPLEGLNDDKVGGPYPIVVLLGGKVFGLTDAPFKSITDSEVTFLAPKDLVRTSRRLIVKRLFLRSAVKAYDVPALSDFAVSGLSVVSSNKSETKYVLLGTALNGASIVPQPKAGVDITENGTSAFFTLSADQTDGLKQVIVKHGTDSPVLVSIPDSKPAATKPQLTPHDPINTGTGVTYTITGTMLDSVASIQYLGKQMPFSLSLDKKSIAVTLPDEMTSSAGIRSLLVTYSDGSTDRYSVTVGKPK